jgi:hypothetical protein
MVRSAWLLTVLILLLIVRPLFVFVALALLTKILTSISGSEPPINVVGSHPPGVPLRGVGALRRVPLSSSVLIGTAGLKGSRYAARDHMSRRLLTVGSGRHAICGSRSETLSLLLSSGTSSLFPERTRVFGRLRPTRFRQRRMAVTD